MDIHDVCIFCTNDKNEQVDLFFSKNPESHILDSK